MSINHQEFRLKRTNYKLFYCWFKYGGGGLLYDVRKIIMTLFKLLYWNLIILVGNIGGCVKYWVGIIMLYKHIHGLEGRKIWLWKKIGVVLSAYLVSLNHSIRRNVVMCLPVSHALRFLLSCCNFFRTQFFRTNNAKRSQRGSLKTATNHTYLNKSSVISIRWFNFVSNLTSVIDKLIWANR